MDNLSRYIYEQVARRNLTKEEAKKLLKELQNRTNKLDDDIAVIGIAGRFPGADNIDQYWQNLLNEANCIARFPLSRQRTVNSFLQKYLQNLGSPVADLQLTEMFRQGGFLSEVDTFDAGYFRISPREARKMDPVQRIFLETAWQAIEDAGYGGEKIVGSKTGVYVGRDHTAESIYEKMDDEDDGLKLTGKWTGILASRLSYIFDLRGPSIVVDTACSSGLMAIHLAIQAIKNRECDQAIAGGIALNLLPMKNTGMAMVESQDAMVRTFDKNANGTVWGEGVGAVMLKPGKQARADGDPIYAIIKASGANNDGASNGITAPNAVAQEEIILNVWKEGKINPETISYVEAHGTGTVLGDPIEIKGLTNAFRKYTDREQFCGIGSVKTSIGHLVGASGMASVLKIILALRHELLPASINFDDPNPFINFVHSPLYLHDRTTSWKRSDTPRRAGISCFGFSGTNCHLVLEEAPVMTNQSSEEEKPQLLVLSAKSEEVLQNLVNDYQNYLLIYKDLDLLNICYTASTGRGHFTYRLALLVTDLVDLKDKLRRSSEVKFGELSDPGIFYGEHRIVTSSKQVREVNELTDTEKGQLSRQAGLQIHELLTNTTDLFNGLKNLALLYTQGADVHWDKLYSGSTLQRINLPVYPLERARHWLEVKPEARAEVKIVQKEINHPLLDRCLADSALQEVYTTEFTVEGKWVLKDHKVMGNYVVPGTTYLEMARAAITQNYTNSVIELDDVIFLTPMVVNEGEEREVHTILTKEDSGDGCKEFLIASKTMDGWVHHATGKIKLVEPIIPDCDLNELKERCTERIPVSPAADGQTVRVNTGPFEFGPHWQVNREGFLGEQEVLVEMSLPDEITDDLAEFGLHPALLDNAVNLGIRIFGTGLYLPFTYKKIRIYRQMPQRIYIHLEKKEKLGELQTNQQETATFSITIFTEDGELILEIVDYVIKKVHHAQRKFKELAGKGNSYYQIGWAKIENAVQITEPESEGKVLVFTGETKLSQEIVQTLQVQYSEVIEVELADEYQRLTESRYSISGKAEDYQQLLTDTNDGLQKIIHLFSMVADSEVTSYQRLQELKARGVDSLFYLSKAIVETKIKNQLDLLLVTENVYQITGLEKVINPHNASLVGLGKVVDQELSNVNCSALDIDLQTTPSQIMAELLANGRPYLTGYRDGQRFGEEFKTINRENLEGPDLQIRDQGVYVITGGTGGLGLEISQYLLSKKSGKGSLKLALLNRRSLPAVSEWDRLIAENQDEKLVNKLQALRRLEELGAEISCYGVDIAVPDRLTEVLDELRAKYGKLNGIIHAAGVAGDGFIFLKDKAVFDQVVRPKVEGTWLLGELTKEDELDFFVLFSSQTALFGGPGQGDYTAANSYLDAYAPYLNRQQRRAVAINWPAWKEVGMAADYGVTEDGIFKTITTAKGLDMFGEILNSRLSRVIPVELNYQLIGGRIDQIPIRLSTELRDIVERQAKKVNSLTNLPRQRTNVQIRGKYDQEFNQTETRLGQIFAQVLEIEEIDIYDNFYDLGGDSILATQLLKELEQEFPGIVDISDIFAYPTIAQLSEYINQKIGVIQDQISEEIEDQEVELEKLLDGLESGDLDIEGSLAILNEMRSKDDE